MKKLLILSGLIVVVATSCVPSAVNNKKQPVDVSGTWLAQPVVDTSNLYDTNNKILESHTDTVGYSDTLVIGEVSYHESYKAAVDSPAYTTSGTLMGLEPPIDTTIFNSITVTKVHFSPYDNNGHITSGYDAYINVTDNNTKLIVYTIYDGGQTSTGKKGTILSMETYTKQ